MKDADGFVFDKWNDGSRPVREVVEFAEAASDPASEGFIPECDRIAVFDMDGTILSENNPGDIEWSLYLHRVMCDPGFHPSEEQRALAAEMIEVIRTGVKPPGFTERKNRCNAKAFAGMGMGEYARYSKEFMDGPSSTFDGAKRRQMFYLPMLQLMEYLETKGFRVFICSATEVLNVRMTLDGIVDVPENQILGTEYMIEASNQNGADGLSYTMGTGEEMVYTDRIIMIASGMNKVVKLAQSIGKRPVMAFGNGAGDYSMLEYVSGNTRHPTKCFMVLADDSEREYGDAERAAPIREHALERGWHPISMRDDFRTIYGDGIRPRYKRSSDVFEGDWSI